jgi:hypothetical protein
MGFSGFFVLAIPTGGEYVLRNLCEWQHHLDARMALETEVCEPQDYG